ncbi:MAG: hypothetical protein MJ061_04345 [Mailhella sp.]|nr:hypothetical protein [Mailhella sp.]
MITWMDAAKVLAVPVLLFLCDRAERRWGMAVASVIVGLPFVSGPASLIVTLEQGREFGIAMAYGALPGIPACIFHGVAYAWLARRMDWKMALPLSLAAYVLFAMLMCRFPHSLPLATAAAFAAPVAGMVLVGRMFRGMSEADTGVGSGERSGKGADSVMKDEAEHTGDRRGRSARGSRLLRLRMLAGAAVMLAETSAAAFVGPAWTGIVIFFPVMSGIVGIFTHIESGDAALGSFYRGCFAGLSGAVAFAAAVAWCLPHFSAAAAYSAALASSLASSLATAFISSRISGRG